METVSLYSTWPDLESAKATAAALVEARLAACVNIIAGAVSIYRWQGETRTDAEVVMLAKTAAARAESARDLILQTHPHATPCVVAVTLSQQASNPDFMAWIAQETS